MERDRERESRFSERERDFDLDFDVSRWLNDCNAVMNIDLSKMFKIFATYFERERERDLLAGDFDFERAPPRDLERLRDFERLRDERADL